MGTPVGEGVLAAETGAWPGHQAGAGGSGQLALTSCGPDRWAGAGGSAAGLATGGRVGCILGADPAPELCVHVRVCVRVCGGGVGGIWRRRRDNGDSAMSVTVLGIWLRVQQVFWSARGLFASLRTSGCPGGPTRRGSGGQSSGRASPAPGPGQAGSCSVRHGCRGGTLRFPGQSSKRESLPRQGVGR